MPPTLRSTTASAVGANGIASQPRRKTSASHNTLQAPSLQTHAHRPNNEHNAMDMDRIPSQPSTIIQTHPYKDLAERVGKEVEQFAEELDRWRSLLSQSKTISKEQGAIGLVQQLRDIATETVDRLRDPHLDILSQQFKIDWSGDQTRQSADADPGPQATSFGDLERWQEELRTWELYSDLLECRFGMYDTSKLVQDNDRFHADGTTWEDFVLSSKSAQEQLVVLKWLETAEETTGHDLELIESELDDHMARTTFGGWDDTRERIKSERRLRLWDTPVTTAQLGASPITDSTGTKNLVSLLDPDAVTRQGLSLESLDEQFERAFWTVIWEMLRRGYSMSEIHDWCAERNHQARAISIGAHNSNCVQTPAARFLWRLACQRLSEVGGVNKQERAVFGLLGGNSTAAEKACKSWRDYKFVDRNTKLLRQYESWLASEPGFPVWFPPQSSSLRTPIQASEQANDEFKVQLIAKVGPPGRDTHRHGMIQGNLMEHKIVQLLIRTGLTVAASFEAVPNLLSDLVQRVHAKDLPDLRHLRYLDEQFWMDKDIMRILVHIYLIELELGLPKQGKGQDVALENIICYYIRFLVLAGKFALVPGYASKLSDDSKIDTLARVCTWIHGDIERKEFATIMGSSDIDVRKVFTRQVELAFAYSPFTYPIANDTKAGARIAIMGPHLDKKWPGQRIVGLSKDEFELGDHEQDLIRSIQSINYLDDSAWPYAIRALTEVAVVLLKNGRIAAAIELFSSMPSQSLNFYTFLDADDINGDLESLPSPDEDAAPDLRRSTRRKPRTKSAPKLREKGPNKSKLRQEMLKSHETTYLALEQLVGALLALMECGEAEEAYVDAASPDNMRHRDGIAMQLAAKERHKHAVGAVVEWMEPLLHDFLLHPCPWTPKRILDDLRVAYLPEMIIAYSSALHCAGYFQSREHLLQCLDLATDIAKNDPLIDCFKAARSPNYFRRGQMMGEGVEKLDDWRLGNPNAVQGCEPGDDGRSRGRLKELVDGFASASKAIIDLNELGGASMKTKSRGKDGRTLAIWDVEEKEEEIEIVDEIQEPDME